MFHESDFKQPLAPALIQALGQTSDLDQAIQLAYQQVQRSALLWHTDFPDGWGGVSTALSRQADAHMQSVCDGPEWDQLRTVQKLEGCLMHRFKWLNPYRPGLMTLQRGAWWHVRRKLEQDYATLDTAWRLAGDRSVDYNFYTKRFFLGFVYLPTYRYWLHDRSHDLTQTQHFLQTSLEAMNQFLKKAAALLSRVKHART